MVLQGCKGFTFLELLFTTSIVVVLGFLGVTGMTSLLQSSSHTTTLQLVITTLDRARSLAVMRGRRTAICMTDESWVCTADWSGENLIVFIDDNKDRKHDSDEEIIYSQTLTASIQIVWIGALHYPVISYQPDGSAVSNGRLELSDKHNDRWKKTIFISKPGRARIE